MTVRVSPGRIVALLSVVVAAALFSGFFRSKGVPVLPVVRNEIVRTVVVTGRVAPLSRAEVGSEIAGRVASVAVRGGDRVRRGDLLALLDGGELRAQLMQADAALAESRTRLEQVTVTEPPLQDQRVREAEATVAHARAVFDRTSRLFADGVAGKSELDAARRDLDVAESRLARERLARKNLDPAGSERRLAESRLAQATSNLEVIRRRLLRTRITAPADGVVITRWVEPGDVVSPGGRVVTLALDGTMELVATVDEKNLPFISQGASARAVADSYPDEPFDARVSRIVPAVDPQRGTVEIRFALPRPPAFLLPDMTVSIEVQGERKGGVLTLPSEAVRDLSTSPWVLAIRDGRAVRVPVTLGIRGVGTCEVTSGVGEGELIISPSAAAVPGDRVRPVPSAPGDAR